MAEGSVEQVLAGEATWCVVHGDCTTVELPPDTFDLCLSDPPYELGFMARKWDRSGVAFRAETWARFLAACKPGAHLFAFGGTRTAHRIACAIEDGGWEMRDSILSHGLAWMYGSGFPKSKNLGGGIGTALKPSWEPIVVARKPFKGTTEDVFAAHGMGGLQIDACRIASFGGSPAADRRASARATGNAPMSNESAADSDSRGKIGRRGDPAVYMAEREAELIGRWPPNAVFTHHPFCRLAGTVDVAANPTWDTPNRETEPSAFTGEKVSKVRHANGRDGEASADRRYADRGSSSFAPLPGARRDTETVEQWECVEGCPVRQLSIQSGTSLSSGGVKSGKGPKQRGDFSYIGTLGANVGGIGDTGTAARYFPQFQHDPELDDVAAFLYQAKAARSERDTGLDSFRARSAAEATDREDDQKGLSSPRAGAGRNGGARNVHPTIKPIELIRWIARLGKPRRPDGMKPLALVPFSGAGSEMVALVLEGYRVIGIELNDSDEEPYVSIARARLHHYEGREFTPRAALRSAEPPKQPGLFVTREP
ncbi:MAG TPA: hypothetical protein VGK73_14760 [Polyangiaceae bacterium]